MCGIFALLNNNYEYTEVKEGTTYYTPTKHIKKDYQIDDIKRYAQRLPNFEMFKIAQCLVEYKYLKKGDKRFFCYIACDENTISSCFKKIIELI